MPRNLPGAKPTYNKLIHQTLEPTIPKIMTQKLTNEIYDTLDTLRIRPIGLWFHGGCGCLTAQGRQLHRGGNG